MCGIAGLVDFKTSPEERVLQAMERTLVHRGPDEGTTWKSPHCGLAHRRLRIIDLSPAAAQPMANEDGRLRVVFNGEIYNFQSLRDELLQLGHHFRSRSDTEVLLHGFESWGLDMVARLRGMFAFALWDEDGQRLVLARDRLGKKPLFYSVAAERLAFGSELRVFKAVPGWPLRVSLPAYQEYLAYGYVQSPETILAEVKRLPAGHFAVYGCGGLQLQRYWSLPSGPGPARLSVDVAAAAQELEGPLRDAVACRLQSDVPLGCFLSGGVDSSLVTALAQESLGQPLKTYTAGFEGSELSEAAHARRVAQRLGTDHHELTVSPASVVREFESILSQAAEPLGDDSYVPTFLISRETRRHVTVAISGDGGDELFAGYSKYGYFTRARFLQRLPLPWKQLAHLAWNDRTYKRLSAMAELGSLTLARWLSSLWKHDEVARILLRPASEGRPADAFERAWQARPLFPEIERWMLADMETYLEGDILVKVDRASMAASLEARSPFLDGPFVEQVLTWPCHAQLPAGGKQILKIMLAKRLPIDWFNRPKQGFGMPIEHWFRDSLRKVLLYYTDAQRLRQRGLLCAEVVGQSVEQHLAQHRNFARKLYAIVAFEIWADQFFGCDAALA